ncbi:hypothetical protein [Streptomyces sp. NPDC003952]
MSTTPVYDLPFLELDDAPDIAGITEDLATAVEAELVRIDASVAAINAVTPVAVNSTTDELNYTGTAFTAGASPVGVSFVAPPSGVVFITLSGYIDQSQNAQASILSYTVRTGSVVGSGTTVGTGANSDRAIVCGRAVVSGAPALIQTSLRDMWSGLTPGAAYNARVEFQTTSGGNMSVYRRALLVEPSI